MLNNVETMIRSNPTISTRLPIELTHYDVFKLKPDAQRREKLLEITEGKRLLRMQIRDLLIDRGII